MAVVKGTRVILGNVVGKKKVKVSKNRKKGWRKQVDIQDIEDHLDERRKDEIAGGPVSEKLNEQLFFVDKEVSEPDQKKSVNVSRKSKPLRCFQVLLPDSQVPPPIIPRTLRKRKLNKTVEPQEECKIKGAKKRALAEKNKRIASQRKKDNKIVHLKAGTYDLWDAKDVTTNLLPEIDEVFKDDVRFRSCKVPRTYMKRTSALPAVEIPDPGASYNPAFEDYQKLMLKAHLVEVNRIKEERRLQRVVTKFSALHPPKEEAWLQEMSQGILGNEQADDDDEEYTGPLSVNPPVRGDRKKPANKRRREKERKKLEIEAKKKKADILRENEIYRLRSIKSQLTKAEKQSQELQAKRRVKERFRADYLPATISRYKYEAPEIEVILPNELPGSMRTLITDGCLLEDRFKSYQRRNVIEPRIKQVKRKIKMKTYQKKGCEIEKP